MPSRLSNSIAADRQRLGLSQQDLARRLGVSQQSVSKWEEGQSVPRPGKLKNLIGLFGKTSLTASAMGDSLNASPHQGVTKEDVLTDTQQEMAAPQAQAIAALARAATELARAAQGSTGHRGKRRKACRTRPAPTSLTTTTTLDPLRRVLFCPFSQLSRCWLLTSQLRGCNVQLWPGRSANTTREETEMSQKIVINTCYGVFSISKEAAQFMADKGHEGATRQLANAETHFGFSFDRTDPLLVAAVEHLGEKASGPRARLKVVEIPDDVEFVINDYDGKEHIAETHRTWY